uniref:Large ribosomal subunit protein mL44 n=1 Tax=Amblyomma cajennense TaxID=34607 RepID=A0A023FKE4_AMBCJ
MECFARCVLGTAAKTLPLLRVHAVPRVAQVCGYKRSLPAVLKEMKARRKIAGPEPLRHRSVVLEWNYDAEIYAFARRLGESWSDITLRTAFVEESYVDREKKQREDLGMRSDSDDFGADVGLTANTQLSAAGRDLSNTYMQDYLTHAFPDLPSDGVEAVKRYLLSDATLSQVSSSIGTSDLIMCADFPPVEKTLANVLMALIGGLLKDSGLERAQLFVRDFVLTQLLGKDLCELWEIPDPHERLAAVLQDSGRPPAEPRLLWESGRNTLEASFCVGLYSDKQLLGYSVGETLSVAHEMAAREALRRFFGLSLNSNALVLGGISKSLSGDATQQSCSTAATP